MDNTVILQSLVTWEGLIDSIPSGSTDRPAELLFERHRLASNKEEFVAALIAKLTMAALQAAPSTAGQA
ncbi:hypothetical protein PQR02_40320 [Paraburkholderia sediminicola]|uniref:Uncharacterized protein n=1 Tax=Paraburkholderia rhynchosiae TaxID=487049 RepID=A0ACC7NT56_9BURK